MAYINSDFPIIEVYVRGEFLHDMDLKYANKSWKGIIFGISSLIGRAIGFHVLLECGAIVFRLPINALMWKHDTQIQNLETLQVWDCMSSDISIHTFEHLAGMRVDFRALNGKSEEWLEGRYFTTLDWTSTTYSMDAGDLGHKCAHIIKLNNGNFAAAPNNRLRWHDPAFTISYSEKPTFKTNTRIWKVEDKNWSTSNSNEMMYDIIKHDEDK